MREREREAADKAKEENDELRRKLATVSWCCHTWHFHFYVDGSQHAHTRCFDLTMCVHAKHRLVCPGNMQLEAKRREQQAEINAAAQAKADTEKLERRLARVQQDRERLRDQLKKASPPSRDHLRRSTQQQTPVQRPAITVSACSRCFTGCCRKAVPSYNACHPTKCR